MRDEKDFIELRDDTVAAFEESTDQLPNDYEMAIINADVKAYLHGDQEK